MTIDADKSPCLEVRKLKDLRPFPLQQDYFPDLDEHELADLTEDIRRNGQRERIQILPDGTVIDGHQRLKVQLGLGTVSMKMRVRYDLEGQPRSEIVRAFLEPNMHRRQLGPLGKARIATALYAAEHGKRQNELSSDEARDARDRAGLAVGLSGRHLDRLMRILETPPAIQAAVEAGTLPIVPASRVAALKPSKQTALAQEIKAGAVPGLAVARYLGESQQKTITVEKELRALLQGLRACQPISSRLAETSRHSLRNNLELLKTARGVIDQLIRRAEDKSLSSEIARVATAVKIRRA